MMAAMAVPGVVVVSDDLLHTSRLRSALSGTALVSVAAPATVPDATAVFVDLHHDVDARLDLIGELRGHGARLIVGFCQHDERAVRVRAMERGADQVVTNGTLQAAALRLLGAPGG